MNIPFNSFIKEYKFFKNEVIEAVNRVLNSGWYILGNECEKFEVELAEYIGIPYIVTVANGTEAISLSLRANDIGPGDEVITTSMTAYPTIVGIVEAGAKPVVVDIDPRSGLINPEKIEKAISSKTKAVMPVHIYGQSCDMDKILSISRKYKIKLIEDCAQSIGAKWKNKMTGSFGTTSAYSFYPTKNLGAYGDGGAVGAKDKTTYTKLKELRNYGQRIRYFHDKVGINSRLDEIQAAILRVKLPYLEKRISRRREIAKYYNENIQSVTPIEEISGSSHTYHLYVVKTSKRKKLISHLDSNGIESFIHYPNPVYKQKAYAGKYDKKSNSVENFCNEILSIPMYPELTDNEVEYIVEKINQFSTSR